MRDGIVRRSIKATARLNFDLNIGLHRALLRLRGERPYRLAGTCQSCAACCEAPGIQVGKITWYVRSLRWLFLWWQEKVNGFVLVAEERPRTFVFRCTHFDLETRKCDSYESRPGMCRDYPRAMLWQSNPELFPECGYRPLAWNAEELRKELESRELEPEQEQAIRKKLFLD